jgi:putative ABC transport system permease protein
VTRSIIAVTLALGVAAMTTAFGSVNAALFRQPPFHEAAQLAVLNLERNPTGEAPRQERWSFARFERLRQSQKSFEDVASYSPASVTLSAGAGAELVSCERVSASYFSVLRLAAARGRVFAERDDDPASPSAVAVIGHSVWTRDFASDPDVLRRTIRLNGVPLTVIGVLPAGFSGLSGRATIWIPRTLSSQITYAEYVTTNQNFIPAIGRLRPGVDLETARSELAILGAGINRSLPSDPENPEERVRATATSLNTARAGPLVRRSLFVLLGAVALLHLLACTNVINLMLGRAAARQREYAVRAALGSSARRLFGETLAEGFVLAAVGGAAGVLLAWWAISAITPPASTWSTTYSELAAFDRPAFSSLELAFGMALALATAGLVAMPSAINASRVDVSRGLATTSRSVAAGGLSLRAPTTRGVIVGVEAALAALLVVAAGLLLASVQRMRQADTGVEPDRILTFWVIPSEARVPPADAPAFITRLLDAIARAPGVESVTVDGGGPLSGSASSTLFIEGQPPPPVGQAPLITRHYVGADHFRTLGIRVLRGRTFSEADAADSPRVAIISDTAARRFWPNDDPIGRRVWFGGGSNFDSPERSAEIVGIVGDVRYQPFDRLVNLASFYTPYKQFTYPARMVFVRTAADPLSVVADVRRAVGSVDPELALQDVGPLADVVSASWARRRFDATLFAGFGIAALLLAASGIFAVLAHSVESRRREFGIRIALGAHTPRVVRQVLREGMAYPIVGLSVGILAAVWFTRVLRSLLFETSPQEPRVFVGVISVLLLASALACLGPAWRATRANPIEALRAE